MNLLEHEAKAILGRYSLPIPRGNIIHSVIDTPAAPIVLKSQVHIGGRGKVGGIKIIQSGDTKKASQAIFDLTINGENPETLLCEEVLDISQEYYLSIMVNRSKACIELLAHHDGGIDIESHDSNEFLRRELGNQSIDSAGRALAEHFDLPQYINKLQEILQKLLTCLVQNDATLIEINPLVLTASGELIAGDCKMTLDDAAAFRHPEWDFETIKADANFVTLDPDGNVATIANGAGLAMATVDSVASAGLVPANFLDIGGGANEASVTHAFERIMEYPQVRGIVINIFAGITRCDEVARAIIAATKNISGLPPLFIRLEGTNYEPAKQLLDQAQIPLLATLEDCITAVKQEIA